MREGGGAERDQEGWGRNRGVWEAGGKKQREKGEGGEKQKVRQRETAPEKKEQSGEKQKTSERGIERKRETQTQKKRDNWFLTRTQTWWWYQARETENKIQQKESAHLCDVLSQVDRIGHILGLSTEIIQLKTHTQFYLGFWGKSHGSTFHRHIKNNLHNWTNFITICVSEHGSPKRTKHLKIKVLLFPLHVCMHACVCYDHSRASMHTYTHACIWLCAM